MEEKHNFDYWDIIVLVCITILTYLTWHLVKVLENCWF